MDELEVDLVEGGVTSAADEENSEVEDAPVVRYIQKILLDAISAGVSDIHFEPYEKFYRDPLPARRRADGGRAAAAGDQGQGRLADQGHLASSTSPRSACRRTAG